jgi:hypothetical protein
MRRDHLGNVSTDRKIILKEITKKSFETTQTRLKQSIIF